MNAARETVCGDYFRRCCCCSSASAASGLSCNLSRPVVASQRHTLAASPAFSIRARASGSVWVWVSVLRVASFRSVFSDFPERAAVGARLPRTVDRDPFLRRARCHVGSRGVGPLVWSSGLVAKGRPHRGRCRKCRAWVASSGRSSPIPVAGRVSSTSPAVGPTGRFPPVPARFAEMCMPVRPSTPSVDTLRRNPPAS